MSKEQLTNKLIALRNRVHGINTWIQENPSVTDPNVYELMDCNIEFAEILTELKAEYVAAGEVPNDFDSTQPMATVSYMLAFHPEIEECYHELGTMDDLRDIANHPFFQTTEVNEMYCNIKACQDFANYGISSDEGVRRVKRELLCKSMSVPFYIWQVKRTEPEYQYDNISEFEGMKSMNALYQASEEPPQFGKLVDALFEKINKNYKYSTPATIQSVRK